MYGPDEVVEFVGDFHAVEVHREFGVPSEDVPQSLVLGDRARVQVTLILMLLL